MIYKISGGRLGSWRRRLRWIRIDGGFWKGLRNWDDFLFQIITFTISMVFIDDGKHNGVQVSKT